ncbi:beta transducin-like protein HET-E2C [Lasiosphaeria hispida]|uniref:Beta transducin-like protein HET-E2C n=1 Tax=Lasiosphaeria hispida TaxID=260671 RepID=A0AAJ0HQY4_9PEZI|nr:beta transducin-like protein HET-E2C [Lasiosphaeria hispida]
MRLLERDNTGEVRLTEDLPDNKIPPYAILSHTWGDGEVLFRDLMGGAGKNKTGYSKIQFCGDQAWRDGLRFFWQDTCCIDKSDAAELQHALNSMFQWYRNAAKCYVYLSDVSNCQQDADGNPSWELAFRKSRWFTRGWTLQELIAPAIIEFFSVERVCLGDKQSLGHQIHNATGIPLGALQGNTLSDFSIEVRMSWVKERNTTRKEDRAYSLFGIFGVCIPLLYGEGEDRAFERLLEAISKHDRYLANLHSTDPHLDKKRIEEAKGGLLANAYRWVLDSPDFCQWRDESSKNRLLWIKGDPGKGKTMLLCGIINELERTIIADGHCRNLAYFFCQATDSRINNAIAVLRGLIDFLAHQQPRLISHVRKFTDAGRSLSDANAWIILSDILRGMLEDPNLKVTYLVVDALDECVVDQPQLLKLIVQISSMSAPVKWIISSRNWVQIEEQLAIVAQQSRLSLELNAKSVTAAVEAFIQHKVLHLSGLKGYDKATENAVHHHLSSNADGTFLWVALVCQALADPNLRGWQTLDKLHAFPPGLDSLYAQMMKHINNSDNAHLCKRILATATIVRRPISLCEFITLVEMPNDIGENPQYLEELIRLCGSFLTLREQIVYFVHQSAKDFLQGKAVHQASIEAFNQIFPRGAEVINHTVFLRSLNAMSTVLRRDIYGLKAPGFPIDEVQTPSPDPLHIVRYSCVFWVDHLCDSISDKSTTQHNIQDAVQIFLEQKYLYWLEALSLVRAMSGGVIAIKRLERLLVRQLIDLVRDAHRFALSCRWIVEQAPLQAYASALVFAPTGSLVRKQFKAEESYWISTAPAVEAEWNACLQTLEGHSSWVRSVAFSPDGRRLASGSDDNAIKIWDTASGRCLETLEGHSSWVWSVAFSPDGRRLASGSDDKAIKIWDMASGRCLETLEGHSSSVLSVAFSPDGRRLASGLGDKAIKIWDMASGRCLETLEGHSSWVLSVAFSPDGRRLASGSGDKAIKIWDTASGRCLETLEGHSSWVLSVAFSPDGRRLASGSDDKAIKIWDTASGRCLETLEGHSSWVWSVAFSPDGRRLASGSDDKAIKIWDTASGRCLETLEGHSSWVWSVAFSPDGRRLASGSGDKAIKIWDTAEGRCLETLEGHSSSVWSVAFSPDGRRLASGSDDKAIKIWDMASGRCLETLEGHSSLVRSVAFSPDGRRLASGSDDKAIKIWDTASGRCLETLEGHSSLVRSVAFSPDGRRLASGSDDKAIKIWDTASGRCLETLEGHSSSVRSVAFSLEDPDRYKYDLGREKTWIICNGQNVLWLPLEYRPECFDVQGRMISIGCKSGRVLTISFSRYV